MHDAQLKVHCPWKKTEGEERKEMENVCFSFTFSPFSGERSALEEDIS